MTARPPPTTFEYIEALALRQPERLAVVENRLCWTYGRVYQDLLSLTFALQQTGLRRGQRVAIAQPSFYQQLMLTLACENLGAVSAAFVAQGDTDAPTLFALVDRVLCDLPQSVPCGVQLTQVDAQWFDPTRAAPSDTSDLAAADRRVALQLDEPQRISRTSGSSGRAKFMLLSRGAQECWINHGARINGYSANTHLLVASPQLINAAYTRSCACLRLGATVYSVSGVAIPDLPITDVWALPVRLSELLDELPTHYQSPRAIRVATVGGAVSAHLRKRVSALWGTAVSSRYGSNEVCGICDEMDDDGIGVLSAGVDLCIVDSQRRELPAGELGIIAVRTPEMVHAYLGAQVEALSDAQPAFQDGWFYSGDWGRLVGTRRLQLIGRHDELVNLGGVKVAAHLLEDKVRSLVALRDCAVVSVNLAGGSITLGMALVLEPETQQAAVLDTLTQGMRLGGETRTKVVFVSALPRTAAGKVDRASLHQLIAADCAPA